MNQDFDRRSGIGASLAPAVCGVSPFGGPLDAYLYLVGLTDGPEETEEMAWGHVVEFAIRREAASQLGSWAQFECECRRHPLFSHLYATPDGDLHDGRGLEIKNVGARHAKDWGEPETDAVPRYVLVQCQMQAAVFGFQVVEVAASIMGGPPVYYHVPRSDALIDVIVTGYLNPFWERVQKREPPPLDWTDPRTPALVDLLHRPTGGKQIDLGADAALLAEAYTLLGQQKRDIEHAQQETKARLAVMMGDAERGLLPDGRAVRRQVVNRKGYTVEPTEYTDFRILKAPKEQR